MIGLAGVALLVGVQATGSTGSLLAAGGLLIAAGGYAIGPMIVSRHLGGFDPRATMGTTLAIAAMVLTPLAVIDWPARAPTRRRPGGRRRTRGVLHRSRRSS